MAKEEWDGLSKQDVKFIRRLDRDMIWYYALFGIACLAVIALIVYKNIN